MVFHVRGRVYLAEYRKLSGNFLTVVMVGVGSACHLIMSLFRPHRVAMRIAKGAYFFITPLPVGISQTNRQISRWLLLKDGRSLTSPPSQCFRLTSLARQNDLMTAYLANPFHVRMFFRYFFHGFLSDNGIVPCHPSE